MRHPDEGTIHAWLDGALPAEEAAELETHVAACPACAAAVADARGLVAGASRILAALDDAPSGVIAAAGARLPTPADHTAVRIGGTRRRRGWPQSPALRIAAAVALVAAGVATIGQFPRLDDGRALRAPRELARDAASSVREEAASPAASDPAHEPGARGAGGDASGVAPPPGGAAAKTVPLAATGSAAASDAGPPPASQGTIGTGAERHREVAGGIGTTPPPPTPGREGALAGAAAADRTDAEPREATRLEAGRGAGAQGQAVAAYSARAAAETTARAPADAAAVAQAAPPAAPAALSEVVTTGVAADRAAAASDTVAAREKARIAAEPRRQRLMAGAVEGRVGAAGAAAVGPLAGCYSVSTQPEGEPIPSPFALDSAVAVAGDAVGWRVRWLAPAAGGEEARALWAPMDDGRVRLTWPLTASAHPPVVVAIEGREGAAESPAGARSAAARRVECP